MPLIEFWEITAFQKYNSWFFPSTSEVALTLVDFKFSFEGSLVLNEKGYLDPIVENCEINFGKSSFTHEDDILEIFYHQLVVFSMVVIENTSFYMGRFIFSQTLGPIMDKTTNHYTYDFGLESPFKGQTQTSQFGLDYKSVYSPFILNQEYI